MKNRNKRDLHTVLEYFCDLNVTHMSLNSAQLEGYDY